MGVTSIEWTDRSVNPIRARHRQTGAVGHYCELFSGGCAHCYASAFQKRFGMPKFPGKGKPRRLVPDDRGCVQINDEIEVFLDGSRLQEVLTRRKPTKWFWCDMTDLFGWWVPKEWLDQIFATMYESQWHTHQLLTKRPARMAEYLTDEELLAGIANAAWKQLRARDPAKAAVVHWTEICRDLASNYPFPNVWAGVSVEDQQRAEERIPWLLKTPAVVRFLSCEPLLGPIDLHDAFYRPRVGPQDSYKRRSSIGIDWVIIGGESGPGARPCGTAWIRSISAQCKAAGVACFVKQLGAHPYEHVQKTAAELLFPNGVPAGATVEGFYSSSRQDFLSDKKGGDPAEWPEDLRVREFPSTEAAHA